MNGPRRVGVLLFWRASAHGGCGVVLMPADQDRYFLHRNDIASGEPVPGSSVVFTPGERLKPSSRYPRALHAVLNARTMAAKTTTLDTSRVERS